MRLLFFIFALILTSCSTPSGSRDISSFSEKTRVIYPEEFSILKIKAKLLANGIKGQAYIYLEVKDVSSEWLDIDEAQLSLRKNNETQKLETEVVRILPGRYYLLWNGLAKTQQAHLKVYYGENLVTGELFYQLEEVIDFNQSEMFLSSQTKSIFKVVLKLRNNEGEMIVTNQTPEILFDGIGHVSHPFNIGKGAWEFTVTSPDENQIIYLGVKIHGQQKDHWLRFQYVER